MVTNKETSIEQLSRKFIEYPSRLARCDEAFAYLMVVPKSQVAAPMGKPHHPDRICF